MTDSGEMNIPKGNCSDNFGKNCEWNHTPNGHCSTTLTKPVNGIIHQTVIVRQL
jgi:hypothetical protein